ncbi:MAG: formylglycine-generating enzyme family protein [Lysobacteraceae bacterium]|nr:MAG: formylglycine-generating enzyme family protein [Xanthomonadaceae bacterium]
MGRSGLRVKRWALAACGVIALVVLGGCEREVAPKRTDAQPHATRARGQVTVSGDDAIADTLTWRSPQVEIGPGGPTAARRRAAAALAKGRLYEDAEAAIPIYLALLARDPGDAAAEAGLARAFERLRRVGAEALAGSGDDADALRRAHEIAAVMRHVGAGRFNADVLAFLGEIDRADRVWELNEAAERELAAGRLGETGGAGAMPLFRQALAIQPDQARAMQGLAAVESALIRRAEEVAETGDFARAEEWLQRAAAVRPALKTAEIGRERVEAIRRSRIARLHDEGLTLLAEPNRPNHLKHARERLAEILRIAAPGDPAAAELRQRIDLAAHYGLIRPVQRFTDALAGGGRGPEMIVAPHGGFQMGARMNEADASGAERPQRYVRFDRGFAIARTEVTVAEFRRFVLASGHRPRAVRRGHSLVYDERGGNFVRRSGVDWRHDYLGRLAADNMPVLHVSAKDAEAYALWLSDSSGQRYRLPSEAEFEYVLRAGGTGRFAWGDGNPPANSGNLTGGGDRSPAGRSWGNAFIGYRDGFWGPAPVASFRANAFGIHDMEGNVSEWVADCWHDGYRRAPVHGEAWVNPGCRTRVVRGGAWASSPAQTRSAWRIHAEADTTNVRTGFRVVRDL